MDGKGSSSRENRVTHMMDRIHPLTHGHTWNQRNGKEKRMFLAFDCLDNSIKGQRVAAAKKRGKPRQRGAKRKKERNCVLCVCIKM